VIASARNRLERRDVDMDTALDWVLD